MKKYKGNCISCGSPMYSRTCPSCGYTHRLGIVKTSKAPKELKKAIRYATK